MQAQELPADSDYAIRIVVVDNDADGSAAAVLEEFGEGTPYPIESVVEPEPGIPFAPVSFPGAAPLSWGSSSA